MKPYSFSKKEHLKKAPLIDAVFEKGILYKTRSLHIYILKNPVSDINRCAFICRRHLYQKKIVLRNRIRRLLREAYRKNKHILPKSHDIMILACHIDAHTKSTIIEDEVKAIFQKFCKR